MGISMRELYPYLNRIAVFLRKLNGRQFFAAVAKFVTRVGVGENPLAAVVNVVWTSTWDVIYGEDRGRHGG
jgi:hypothetical protein